MVRRRPRIPKTTMINHGDQNFASPKRKDAKIDNSSVSTSLDVAPKLSAKLKTPNISKSRGDRTGGKTIGVPLATRSQTKTIENFFKAKTAAKLKQTKDNKTSSDLNTLPKIENHSPCAPDTELANNHLQVWLQDDYFFELSDTNDTDNTELSGGSASGEATGDFATHRAQLRDSCSSHSSSTTTTDNIFLQEPVLTLNVDKTLNQASSIKINNTLATEPVFSSPPSITAAALHGRFNQIVSLASLAPENHRQSFEHEENKTSTMLLLPESESSSSDSGVALGSMEQNETLAEWNIAPADLQMRCRKPATPHRILCPSPVKVVSRVDSPSRISQTDRNAVKYKEHLSPRKTQRHQPAPFAAPKTRRRLNPTASELLIHPIIINIDDSLETNEENACSLKSTASEKALENHIQCFGTDREEAIAFDGASNDLTAPKTYKTNFDFSKNLPITTAKTVQPKSKQQKQQSTRPLTVTNGNREMSEFFPVRRSVRKTKSVVKQEIMQNFEQAILEERSEGLQVEYFDGKGRGVVANRRFQRGEFVIEYVGDFIKMTEAAEREQRYAVEDAGCYMYYFRHRNQQYCIDATADTGKFGRLLNHSRNGNLITKVIEMKQRPHLILVAKDDIEPGEELTYDYGDRSKVSLMHHPWLAF